MSVEITNAAYSYPGHQPVLENLTLRLPPGARCLLVGPNGGGKSTLLRLLAGKHMVDKDAIKVMGKSPFYDMSLTSTGTLTYLGPHWKRTTACVGHEIAMQGDVTAEKLIFGIEDVDPVRRQQLLTLLRIDLSWKLNTVSDGQRRRIQICLGLLKPFKVLLMDEVTVDMDIVSRHDLLAFLSSECEQSGSTVVYATHIFDGLDDWMTHLAYVANGELVKFGSREGFSDLAAAGAGGGETLLNMVTSWLREDRDARRRGEQRRRGGVAAADPFASSARHMAYYR